MLFDLANLPYWIFLGSGTVLFLFVILSGGGGDDDLDLDLDADVEADFDFGGDFSGDQILDFDADADGEAEGGLGAAQLLGWFGIGRAPLILLIALDLCLWGLFGWMLNVILGNVLGGLFGSLIELGVLLVSFLLAVNIGGLVARPLGRVFASFTEDSSSDRIIGCVGTVTSASIPFVESGKIGQVDVLDAAHNRVTISAMLPNWAEISLRYGAKILVIERHPKGFVVIAKDSIDQQRWMDGSTSAQPPSASPLDSAKLTDGGNEASRS